LPATKRPARKTATREEAEVDFSAAFEGAAVEAGRMSAKQFAPSLFATATLVERAAEVLFQGGDGVTVQVKADFRRGSFEYELVAAAVTASSAHVLQNLSISDIDLLLRAIGLRGGDPNSLLGYLLQWGDKTVERVEPAADGKVTLIINGDHAQVTVNNIDGNVARLVMNERVREAVPDVVAPLTQEGIDRFRIGSKRHPELVVEKKDVPKFQTPIPLKSELTDSVAVTAVEILSPSFVDGNKWRVAQGGDPFWVRILDEQFLDAVNRGERGFYKGDYLVVEMRTRAYATSQGLEAEREALKVLEYHRRGGRQGSLFDSQ
jgi:hypothetical protein